MEKLLTHADDNYFGELHEDVVPAMSRLKVHMERAIYFYYGIAINIEKTGVVAVQSK